MLRFILLIIIGALAYSLFKKIQKGGLLQPTNNTQEPTTTEMKRCAKCGVHLPVNDSIQYQTLHFCCEDHKKAYLVDHASGDDTHSNHQE
ncbi:MAG: hypothetical protein CSA49_03535 [Gammaproteobacteria bacterium]|nr:MAG: hypothetical protein CSA49_03535 [Gammaproteobacteria bacterium]